jgi:tetratricopeptide (TPR) repeat protein
LDWSAISGTEKLLTFVKESELTKRTKDQTEKGNEFYNKGISLMEKGDYSNAILEFKQAMKKYKRAKLNDDALNYIRTNMGLSYASQAGKSNQAAAKKQLSMITKRAYNDKKLLYNIAIANYHAGNQQEAITLLSLAIRKDEFYYQAYVSLEEIFKRNPKTLKDAQKINTRLTKAVEKQKRKNEIDVENQKNVIEKNNSSTYLNPPLLSYV